MRNFYEFGFTIRTQFRKCQSIDQQMVKTIFIICIPAPLILMYLQFSKVIAPTITIRTAYFTCPPLLIITNGFENLHLYFEILKLVLEEEIR
jgi:hypothetical protein